MTLGGFVSAQGGLHKALERAKEETFESAMFFIGSPRSWRLPTTSKEDGELFKQTQKDLGIKSTYAHGLYLANLATPVKEQWDKSVEALTTTMKNGETIGLTAMMFHPGSHKKTSAKEGIKRVQEGLAKVLEASPGKTKLLVENCVGNGDKVGLDMKEIGEMIKPFKNEERIGMCFDTCHAFAMGVDYKNPEHIKQLLDDIDTHFGIEKLECFHLNDSLMELGGLKDRHANIGEGFVGVDGFKAIFSAKEFQDKTFLLEVPGIEGQGPGKADAEATRKILQQL